MAEELTGYLIRIGIKTQYIHSDVETLDRVEILKDLRYGSIDVLVGVNLLREGLDLPEVSLVAIMDADKEGFLRNERSLTQTSGRAARHINGHVIFYANKMTKSMIATIDETNRRRAKQLIYNEKNNIIPTTIIKSDDIYLAGKIEGKTSKYNDYKFPHLESLKVAETEIPKMLNKEQLQHKVKLLRKNLEAAVMSLDFMLAANLRDEIQSIEKYIREYDLKK